MHCVTDMDHFKVWLCFTFVIVRHFVWCITSSVHVVSCRPNIWMHTFQWNLGLLFCASLTWKSHMTTSKTLGSINAVTPNEVWGLRIDRKPMRWQRIVFSGPMSHSLHHLQQWRRHLKDHWQVQMRSIFTCRNIVITFLFYVNSCRWDTLSSLASSKVLCLGGVMRVRHTLLTNPPNKGIQLQGQWGIEAFELSLPCRHERTCWTQAFSQCCLPQGQYTVSGHWCHQGTYYAWRLGFRCLFSFMTG